MPFYFAKLPSYKPKLQEEKEIIPPSSTLTFQKEENGNHIATFKKDSYKPEYDPFLINQGAAEVSIEENGGKLKFSFSPLGFKHANLPESEYTLEKESFFKKIKLTSF